MKVVVNKKIIIFLSLSSLLFFIFFLIGFYNYLHPNLKEFEIINVVEKDNSLYLNFSASPNSIEYKITCEDENNNVVYETKSDENIVKLNDFYEENGKKYMFTVTAFNKKSESLLATNTYLYTSKDATISSNNEHYTNSAIYNLNIDGDANEYKLEMYYEGNILGTLEVNDNVLAIPTSIFDNLSGKVILKLKNRNDRITSTFNLYINTPVVGNINITNLLDVNTLDYSDLDIEYTGGINATKVTVNLYNQGQLESSFSEDNINGYIKIPANMLRDDVTYNLELVASYKDFYEVSKKDNVSITILPKENVKPVYTDKNFTYIKKGSSVRLISDTNKAIIYYTLDGKEPTEESNLYEGPITINEDVTIKAKAYKKYNYESEVTSFDFKVGEKNLVVYLSPSNQGENYGIKSAGYTTEKQVMNKLTDYLEKYLKDHNVKVYRNRPNGNINLWLSESNYVKSDLHLAIHSNGSELHDTHGMEIYVDNASSKSYSIASNIYHNLYSIYPNKDNTSDRGIKYANKSLGEANDSFHKNATLIEIAYHDDYNDAKWIVDNKEEIAKNIGDSILNFYQVE